MTRHYYAAYNSRADLENGNRGFRNTWEIVRFGTRADRDAFVEMDAAINQRARALTRKQAAAEWADNYWCTGDAPPHSFDRIRWVHPYGLDLEWGEHVI